MQRLVVHLQRQQDITRLAAIAILSLHALQTYVYPETDTVEEILQPPKPWPTTRSIFSQRDGIVHWYACEEYPSASALQAALISLAREGWLRRTDSDDDQQHANLYRWALVGIEAPEALCELLTAIRCICHKDGSRAAAATGIVIVKGLPWSNASERYRVLALPSVLLDSGDERDRAEQEVDEIDSVGSEDSEYSGE